MKKHLSKRLLSLLLAVAMLFTSAPIVAYAYELTDGDDDVKYLFAYFTSNTQYGQQIRFAVSEDGLNYTPLNNNSPVITHSSDYFDEDNVEANTQYALEDSSSAGYSRDPYIFKGEDGNYYMVATDMDASEDWSGDTCMVFWKSEDLIDWYQISVFDVSDKDGFESTIRAWAPQVIYDEDEERYMVYWANFFAGWVNEGIYYCYTDDFKTFTTPGVLYRTDSGKDAIDADIVEYNDTYYMFYKDENAGTVVYVTSDSLTGPYSDIQECTVTSNYVEGNFMYQLAGTDNWVLMLDEYVNGSYVIEITSDFKTYELLDTSEYSFSGFSPRHGSVVQITTEEYNELIDAYSAGTDIGTIEYPFSVEGSYDTSNWYNSGIVDGSGHTFDVAVGAWINGLEDYVMQTNYGKTDAAYATTGGGFITFMSNIFINDTDVREYLSSGDFTVSFDYTPYMDSLTDNENNLLADWTDGESNGDQEGSVVIFAISTLKYGGTEEDNPVDFIRVLQDGSLEVYNGSSYEHTDFGTPSTGVSANYTITYDGETTTLYIDNVWAAEITCEIPGIDGGYSGNGYSFYASLGWTDACANHYKPFGKYENLVFYNRAFTATEAQLGMATDLTTIDGCIATFESLLNSGETYLNTAEAFEYYTQALRLTTVRDYGTTNVTAELAECLANFSAAIENMSHWTGTYKTTSLYTAYFSVEEVGANIIAASGSTYDESAKNDTNGWLVDGTTGQASYNITSSTTTYLSVYGDSYIMLYDGTSDISAPLKFRYYSSTGFLSSNNGLISIYLNNNDLDYNTGFSDRILLTGITSNDTTYDHYHWADWRTDTQENYEYVANYEVDNSQYYTVNNTFSDGTVIGFHENTGTIHYYANTSVTYSGTPTSTLTTVNPNVIFVDAYGNHTSFGNNGAACSYGTGVTSNRYTLNGSSSLASGYSSSYYIIDVSDIYDALSTVTTALSEDEVGVASFSYDMLEVFEQLQDAMEYEPYDALEDYRDADGYISRGLMYTAAQSVADKIDEITSSFSDGVEVEYIDYDGYEALKTARGNSEIEQIYKSANSDGTYTTETWEAFADAYETALGEINRLVAYQFRNNDETEVEDAVEALYEAYYGLRQCADFTDVQGVSSEDLVTVYNEDGEATDETISSIEAYDNGDGLGTVDNQNYTYGSWYNFETAYENVAAFNDTHSESDYAMYDSVEITIETGAFEFTVQAEANGTYSEEKYSEEQQKSWELAEALREAAKLLAPVAPDYSVYNAVTEEIKNQDVGAFANGEDAALYTLLKEQGTQDASVTYSVNGSVTVVTPVFDAANNVIEDEDGNKSINETAYVVADGTVWKNMSVQNDLDLIIKDLIEGLNYVNEDTSDNNDERAKYTVTYTVMNGETVVSSDTYTYYYGQTFTATVEEGKTVYKWVVESDDGVKTIPSSAAYSAYITRDVKITAYLSQTDEDNEDQITLQILNQYGNLINEFYVDYGTEVTVGKKYITIGDKTYTADDFSWLADTPFYTFDGWQVNSANYNNDTTFTVDDVVGDDGVVKLKIKMNVTSDAYTISLDGSPIGNYVYDQEVTIELTESADENQEVYGIAIQIGSEYYVVSYGSEDYTFYVAGGVDLFTIYQNEDGSYTISGTTFTEKNAADFVEKLDNKLPFSYSIGKLTDGDNVFTTYSASTANVSSVEVTEVGTIYTTSSAIGEYSDAFVLDTSGVSCVAATNQNTDTMQYALRLSGCYGKTVYTRSYVKYKYTYTTSDGQTTTIQTVVYGNIVSNTD